MDIRAPIRTLASRLPPGPVARRTAEAGAAEKDGEQAGHRRLAIPPEAPKPSYSVGPVATPEASGYGAG